MSRSNQVQDEDLFNLLISEANQPFVGWDFSYLLCSERMIEAPLIWGYASMLLLSFRNIQSLLAMGTGDEENLSLLQPLPPDTCATEGYAPNVPVTRRRLEPLGVKVYQVDDDQHLPFEDNQFDLIGNRHASYSPQELWRILKPGCRFITQQVGSSNNSELNTLLGAEKYPYTHWTLNYAVRELEAAGWYVVEQKEDHPIRRFFDVGAIVYYLKAVPWQVSDFSVEKYFEKLVQIHNFIQRQSYIDVHDHRFLIVAQKG